MERHPLSLNRSKITKEDLKPITGYRKPLTIQDLKDDLNYLPIPEDTLQLQVDMLNVYQGTVALGSFPEDYQEKRLEG